MRRRTGTVTAQSKEQSLAQMTSLSMTDTEMLVLTVQT